MKKVILHIALFTFIAFFTAASGGLFFIIHHCAAHQVNEIRFVNREGDDCCHHATQDHQACTSAESCCATHEATAPSVSTESVSCCSNSTMFLKVPFQYLKSAVEKIQAPVIFITDALPAILKSFSGDLYDILTPPFSLPPGESPASVSLFNYSILRL